ncbi:polymorphic toxin-type HINT domain-containing protein [Nonomuraea dietziae]|uniref:Intein C-terminal splicing domain-containing protein n=1 Tax=Nonomuraea dietziae TaxID=65515 RepID=A0A7W5VID2_9ACTN|nr:polymorphic toxin-type HINT domain-containing protein [Nonomuraea dietziae]MBB3728357.1 hypothetical protein [Nonomuraea dietziae]
MVALIVGNGAKNLVDITVDTDGSGGSETGVIVATDNHPFWVPVLAEWKDAITLEPGQWLQTSAGANVQITAVTRRLPLNERVHNLTIADLHTYHVGVGAVDALVHNEVCDAAWGGALHIQEEWQKGNRNHGIPGVDMRNVDQIAEYLDGILTGPGGRSVQGGKTVYYDEARGYMVLRASDYMATGRKMSKEQFSAWYNKHKDN